MKFIKTTNMIIIENIELKHLFVVSIILFIEYLLVLLAVFADLISGVRKAKKRGEVSSSFGFRRTTEKLGSYYLLLFALTIVDLMQIAGVWYFDQFYDFSIPIFPIITLLGSLGIGLIEVKSIFEKAEDKVKFERVGELAGSIIKNKDDAEKIIAVLAEYLNSNKQEETRDDTNR